MRPGLATSISVIGVLAAGGAALALNSTVLDGNSSVAVGTPALAAAAPAGANTATAEGIVAGQAASGSGNGDAAGMAAGEPQGTTRVANTTTYTIGTAGRVVVDMASGAVLDAIPNTGWSVEPVRQEATGSMLVSFVKSNQRIDTRIAMNKGVPNISVVNNTTTPAPIGTVTPTPPPSTVVGRPHHDDDDHDEDEEHEEHEDDD